MGQSAPELPANLTIRAATDDDISFLTEVVLEATRVQGRMPADFNEREWRNGFGKWTAQQVRGELDGNATSVIEVDGQRVGRLRVIRSGDRVELAGIQLHPRVQRRGIGTAIVESLKAEAAAACVPVELGVEYDNPDARRLYSRLGFVEVGRDETEVRLRWSPP